MTYLFIGMTVGGIIGATVGCLFSALKNAEKEIRRINDK